MKFLLRHFAPFPSMKVSIINALLCGLSDTSKTRIIGMVLAKSMPQYHIHKNPKR
jgi:hypothetical protein